MSRIVQVFAPTKRDSIERLAYFVVDGVFTADRAAELACVYLGHPVATEAVTALVEAVRAEDAGGERVPVDEALDALLGGGQ